MKISWQIELEVCWVCRIPHLTGSSFFCLVESLADSLPDFPGFLDFTLKKRWRRVESWELRIENWKVLREIWYKILILIKLITTKDKKLPTGHLRDTTISIFVCAANKPKSHFFCFWFSWIWKTSPWDFQLSGQKLWGLRKFCQQSWYWYPESKKPEQYSLFTNRILQKP